MLLSVADDCPGLDEHKLAHLFSPLMSGASEDSAGLGLATVYGIVKQCEGFAWTDSTPGDGTPFRIYFPRLAD